MTIRLRDELEQLTAAIGDLSNAERAIAAARGRRKRNGLVGAISALAVGATVLAIGLNRSLTDETPPPVTISQVLLQDWVPEPRTVGAPAPVGTMMLRSCASTCSVKLLKPDKSTIDLAELRPDLARLISTNGWEGASLSPDAQWLGLPSGAGFDIYNLANPEQVYRLPAGTAESQWRVIGWNNNVTLVSFLQGRAVDYAVIDLGSGTQSTYQPPGAARRLPVGVGGVAGDVALAEPIDITVPVAQRTRMTAISVSSLVIVPNPAESQTVGEENGGQMSATDFSASLRPNETLAGPAGVPVTATVLDPAGEQKEELLTTVFARRGEVPTPVAIIRPDAGQRFDVPPSAATTTWSFLAVQTTGGIAVRRTQPGKSTADIVRIDAAGKQSILQTVPKDDQVLLPGMG